MRLPINTLLALLFFAFVCGCHNTTDEDVIAEVYGHRLLRSDVSGVVAAEVTPADSAAIMERYINQWIDHIVLLRKAEKNIKDDFAAQLEQYRNSLLIYAYEQKIIGQLIDTTVTDTEIQNYYSEHRDDFVLKRPLVQAMYVKLGTSDPNLNRMKTLMNEAHISEESLLEIQRITAQSALDYSLDDQTWQPIDQLRFKLPNNVIEHPYVLHNRHSTQLTDSNGIYLVHISDVRMVDDYAPVASVYENIKVIILNQRKEEIVTTLRHDLRRKAESDNAITIYGSKPKL